MDNLALVMNKIKHSLKKRTQRKIYYAIDLHKAYDRLDHQQLF